MRYQNVLSICAAIGITAGAVAALAPPASGKSRPIVVEGRTDLVTRHVSYADLNLASTTGERTLNRRVSGAVNSVCLEAVGGYDAGTTFKFSMLRCSSSAWNGARPQITRAVERAHQIAATGSSSIAATAIVITIPE